jgi:Uma2 family endonuclease
MEATLEKRKTAKTTLQKEKYVKPLYHGLEMSIEDFLDWKPEIVDNWKNELINSKIVSSEEKMKQSEAFILKNINRVFCNTIYWKNGGELFSELKFKINSLETVRIPDLCFMNSEEILKAKIKTNIIPSFIIEIVSTFDQSNGYEQKLREYFQCGVQCVWLIFPIYKEVKVYTSIRNCTICLENDICSAAPALPEFELICDKIFE